MRYKWLNILLTMLCLVGCQPRNEQEDFTRKVIVYMAARNNLSPFANQDFREMQQAMDSIPTHAEVLVMLETMSDDARLYRLTKGKCSKEITYPADESGCDSAIFAQRLREIDEKWPTEHTGLVLWSHGTAWMPDMKHAGSGAVSSRQDAFGRDDTQDSIRLSVFAVQAGCEALSGTTDYIYFDACHMQSIEVAYQLRHVTKQILATAAEMPGEGAPYDKILPALCLGDMKKVGDILYDTYNNDEDGIILSLVNTEHIERMAGRMKEIISVLFADKKEYDMGYPYATSMSGGSSAQQYSEYKSLTGYMPDFYDMTSAIHRVDATQDEQMTDIANEVVAKKWMTDTWYSASMGHRGKVIDRNHSCGLSMYIPMSHYKAEYTKYFHQFDWYHDAGWDQTGW